MHHVLPCAPACEHVDAMIFVCCVSADLRCTLIYSAPSCWGLRLIPPLRCSRSASSIEEARDRAHAGSVYRCMRPASITSSKPEAIGHSCTSRVSTRALTHQNRHLGRLQTVAANVRRAIPGIAGSRRDTAHGMRMASACADCSRSWSWCDTDRIVAAAAMPGQRATGQCNADRLHDSYGCDPDGMHAAYYDMQAQR